ncbi:MAG: hypothetical protein ACYC27_20610 [Armatimonadota bacterium]
MNCTQEQTGYRSSVFSNYFRSEGLPSASVSGGYVVLDIDFMVMHHGTKQVMMIEEKTYGAVPKSWQASILKIFGSAFAMYFKYIGWNWRGLHFVKFEKTGPYDGRIWLDGKEITEPELRTFIRFGIE